MEHRKINFGDNCIFFPVFAMLRITFEKTFRISSTSTTYYFLLLCCKTKKTTLYADDALVYATIHSSKWSRLLIFFLQCALLQLPFLLRRTSKFLLPGISHAAIIYASLFSGTSGFNCRLTLLKTNKTKCSCFAHLKKQNKTHHQFEQYFHRWT